MKSVAQRFDLLEGDQTWRLVAVHAARLVVDDVLEPGQPFPHFQHLVDLLLILGHDDTRLGDLQHAGKFVGDAVLIEPQGENAGGLGGQLRDHPLRRLSPMIATPVAFFHTQLGQPE